MGICSFDADERRSQCGIHVADDDQLVGPMLHEFFFETPHNFGNLLDVRPRPDPQIDVGLGNAKFREKIAAHLAVVMLAGVNQSRVGTAGIERAAEAARFS